MSWVTISYLRLHWRVKISRNSSLSYKSDTETTSSISPLPVGRTQYRIETIRVVFLWFLIVSQRKDWIGNVGVFFKFKNYYNHHDIAAYWGRNWCDSAHPEPPQGLRAGAGERSPVFECWLTLLLLTRQIRGEVATVCTYFYSVNQRTASRRTRSFLNISSLQLYKNVSFLASIYHNTEDLREILQEDVV